MFSDYDTHLKDKKAQFHKTSRLVNFYMRIVLIEYRLIQVFLKISVPLKLGYTVISYR